MNEEIFRQYLNYKANLAREAERPRIEGALVSEHFGNRKTTKGERKQYRKSLKFLDLVQERLDSIPTPPEFEYENAIQNETLVQQYMQYEPTAVELLELGCEDIDFEHIHSQHFSILLEGVDFEEEAKACLGVIVKKAIKALTSYFSKRRLEIPCGDEFDFFPRWPDVDCRPYSRDVEMEDVDEENIDIYAETVREGFDSFYGYVLDEDYSPDYLEKSIAKYSQAIASLNENKEEAFQEEDYYPDDYYEKLSDAARSIESDFVNALKEYFSIEKIDDLVASNPNYQDVLARKDAEEKKNKELLNNIVEVMPDSLEDLYPATRQIHRKFILHVGPTNSGKTHDAMQAMIDIGSGVYLAPLRLLAYEQYENLNTSGHPCSMVTGEEQLIEENASFTASTVEMLRVDTHYACAVIDEAQMVADRDRGGAWTRAILGVAADVVHVCLAPEAESAVIRLIQLCKDEYEIVRHERKTPLVIEYDAFHFPVKVRPHDALIVFSRRNVHAVAAELQKNGTKCSIIYGALPYDVRHEEARKFLAGETDVVVSTDAIGMGMNLPIERVVFLETAKFDGETRRRLTVSEIKQITGRAGRYGVFEKGFVNALENRAPVQSALDATTPLIRDIHVSFPEALIGIEGDLSDIISQWDNVTLQEGFVKESTATLLNNVVSLEHLTSDKRLVYDLASIPFDERNVHLRYEWEEMSNAVIAGEDLHLEARIEALRKRTDDDEALEMLEDKSKLCDLLYNFDRRFCNSTNNRAIAEVRNRVSRKIMKLLSTSRLESRTCKYCGKILPWNYAYGMCQKCHDEMYPPRGGYWNDWHDEY